LYVIKYIMTNAVAARIDGVLSNLEAREAARVSPGELAPVTFHPIHEVTEASQLAPALSDVMDSRLPGFVIRNANSLTPDAEPPEELVAETLKDLGFTGFQPGHDLSPVTLFSPHDGTLRDYTGEYTRSDPWFVKALNINTVTEGMGLIVVAEAGSHYRDVWHHVRRRGSNPQAEFWADLSEQLQAGLTYPRVMNSDVYWGEVGPEDSMVFPDSNRNGPVINRIDNLPYLPYTPEENERFPISFHPYGEDRAWLVRERPALRDRGHYAAHLFDSTDHFANLRTATKNILVHK
jgi:hypothetical protein